jgi:hypothetical protein
VLDRLLVVVVVRERRAAEMVALLQFQLKEVKLAAPMVVAVEVVEQLALLFRAQHLFLGRSMVVAVEQGVRVRRLAPVVAVVVAEMELLLILEPR